MSTYNEAVCSNVIFFIDRYDAYVKQWASKDEKENFSQKHDSEIIKSEKRMEVETEVTVILIESS